MRPGLTALLLAYLVLIYVSRPAHACQCIADQPRLLIPAAGVSQPIDRGILVRSSLQVQPFLFDADGTRVDLVSIARAGSPELCGYLYELFAPARPVLADKLDLLLADGSSPDAPYALNNDSGLTLPHTSVMLSATAGLEVLEPFEPLCAGSLNGATIVSHIFGTVELVPNVPVFVQATTADSAVGELRDFSTNIHPDGVSLTSRIDFDISLTAQSNSCVAVQVFDWALRPVWAHRFCPLVDSTRVVSEPVSVEAPLLPERAERSPPSRALPGGCAVSSGTSRRPFSVAAALLLAAIRAVRQRRAPFRSG
jgi:hypothetical protein